MALEQGKVVESQENLELTPVDVQYLQLVKTILAHGREKTDPQGVGNLSIHGYTLKYDLSRGKVPLISLRDLWGSWGPIIAEFLMYLSGEDDVTILNDQGIHFLDKWAEATHKQFGYPKGKLGPGYGKQLRAFSAGGEITIDQLAENMNLLQTFPDSRRIASSLWNPKEINEVFVAPCVRYIQFHHAQGRLNLSLVHGSADVTAGVPFDIVQYSILLRMAAMVNNMQPGELGHYIVDGHIYKNQIQFMEELVRRDPHPDPTLIINSGARTLFDFKVGDFELKDYYPHPRMNIPVPL